MGWLFCKPTREALVQHLLQAHGAHLERVDDSQQGNNLWVLYRSRETGETFITLFKLSGTRGNGNGFNRWGYKDVDESMGPCDESCPIRLLRGSTSKDPVSTAWRQRCLARHTAAAEQRSFVRNLKDGDLFVYRDSVATFKGICPVSGHPTGIDLTNGIRYAFEAHLIKAPSHDPVDELGHVAAQLRDEYVDAFGTKFPIDEFPVTLRMFSQSFGWALFTTDPETLATFDTTQPIFLYATSNAVAHGPNLPIAGITRLVRLVKARAHRPLQAPLFREAA